MMPHTLFQAAMTAMAQSHSPYSEFPVGAALRSHGLGEADARDFVRTAFPRSPEAVQAVLEAYAS